MIQDSNTPNAFLTRIATIAWAQHTKLNNILYLFTPTAAVYVLFSCKGRFDLLLFLFVLSQCVQLLCNMMFVLLNLIYV